MELEVFLKNRELKPKQKTEILAESLLGRTLESIMVIHFARVAKDPEKATCIEAFEYATRMDQKIASIELLEFVIESLESKAPRVKWESAKVLGNIAATFPNKLGKAIIHLLKNSEHTGTVVRWSAAFALGEILKLKTPYNKELIPAVEAILKREEKKSIQKIYLHALKNINAIKK